MTFQDKLNKAIESENKEDFFSASHFYKDALSYAIKIGDSGNIKLCKNKIVEMNKESIASGKDFKELSFTHELSEEKQKIYDDFLKNFFDKNDLKSILDSIGKHPYFFPKVKKVQETTNKTMPVSYQVASLSAISDNGHALRGGSDGDYAWFMKMYDISQQTIIHLYIGKIFYELIENKPNNICLDFEKLSDYFSESEIFKENNLKIIIVGLEKYFKKDYISALHILIPRFESAFLDISAKLGIDIVALEQRCGISTRTKTLSETHLDSEEFKKIWGEDLCRQLKFVLFEQMGYKLRHKIAHGEILHSECNFQNTTLILYFYIVLISRVVKNKT